MKKIIVLAVGGIVMLTACKKEEVSPFLGKYKLIETLSDPGDGSGTFQAVTSDKMIEFEENHTVTSNGDLCSMSKEADGETTGTYSDLDSVLHSTSCSLDMEFDGNELIIIYPCIEPCKAKYIKQ